jgi:hypothetical protein
MLLPDFLPVDTRPCPAVHRTFLNLGIGLLNRLCHAAKLLSSCQEYMCRPEHIYAKYGKEAGLRADVHLEVALLAVYGYDIKSIGKKIIRLASIGSLVGHEEKAER